MVDQGLFENNSGMITCYKMLKRLDQSMTSNKEFRIMIDQAKRNNHDDVMISHDAAMIKSDLVMQEENRLHKNKKDKDTMSATPPVDQVVECVLPKPKQIMEMYNSICTNLPNVRAMTAKRGKALKARISGFEKAKELNWWENYFGYVNQNEFLTGTNDRNWKPNLDWLLNEDNMIKVVERKYEAMSK
jgi:hypothetical protein